MTDYVRRPKGIRPIIRRDIFIGEVWFSHAIAVPIELIGATDEEVLTWAKPQFDQWEKDKRAREAAKRAVDE